MDKGCVVTKFSQNGKPAQRILYVDKVRTYATQSPFAMTDCELKAAWVMAKCSTARFTP